MSVAISSAEVAVWSRYIQDTCGIVLDQSKAYLLETRLDGILRETGATSFSGLYYKVKADASNTLRGKVVDAITTNETSFFRDTSPFELLRHKLLPERSSRQAGSSPYSDSHLERCLLDRARGLHHRNRAQGVAGQLQRL